MAKYKTWIIVGIIVLILLIIFYLWKRSNDKKLAQQAYLQQQQFYGNAYPTTATTAAGGASATISSLNDLVSGIGSLFGKNNTSNAELDLRRRFENECESMYNTQPQVDACVAQKLASVA